VVLSLKGNLRSIIEEDTGGGVRRDQAPWLPRRRARRRRRRRRRRVPRRRRGEATRVWLTFIVL
jgi:hypothetical protein